MDDEIKDDEILEQEASEQEGQAEGHSDYKPVNRFDAEVSIDIAADVFNTEFDFEYPDAMFALRRASPKFIRKLLACPVVAAKYFVTSSRS